MRGFRRWRNRLLSDPRFHRFATRFFLTRPFARRHAGALFDLCAGFVYTQVMQACVTMELFELLHLRGPRSLEELAVDLAVPPARLEVLLRAAVTLRLLDRVGERQFDLGPRGAMLLGNPGVIAMVRHHGLLYRDLADPLALLRGTSQPALAAYWGYAGSDSPGQLDAAAVVPYSELMASSQTLLVDLVLAAYPLGRHRNLLDVGGGLGIFAEAAKARYPQLEVTVLDLPAVAEAARARIADGPWAGRIDVRGADAFRDPLPEGADVVSLVRIVHDHDDAAVAALFRRIRSVLPEEGALLIAEPLAGTRGAEAMGDAYFGFYLLAMGSGRPRTYACLQQMLEAAGFSSVREYASANPVLLRILVARP